MDSIYKTYINGNEYELYRNWWIDNYEKMKKEIGEVIYLLPLHIIPFTVTSENIKNIKSDVIYYQERYNFPIWETTEKQDLWLIKNCNIDSYRKRLLEVYPKTWKGFKGCTWVTKNNTK